MAAFNAHRVFTDSPTGLDYLQNITPPEQQIAELRAARDEIRSAIREDARTWAPRIRPERLIEKAVPPGVEPHLIQPKFRMQGSLAYHTLNDPAQSPPQEIDLDDGLFLPVSFFEVHGRLTPGLLSNGLFCLVEVALVPLCRRRGWELNRAKPSCVRVQVSNTAHIDIALYAIPDEEFAVLAEKAARDRKFPQIEEVARANELSDDLYSRIPRDHIVLAHREEGWKPSDPRQLEDWFRASVKDYGPQLRRVCRYLKAWRDEQWETSTLSSIGLMYSVVKAYEALGDELLSSRDDVALMRVTELLPGLLSTNIPNPVVDGQRLDESWSTEDRQAFVSAAQELAASLRASLTAKASPADVLVELSGTFGDRIPRDPELVQQDSPSSATIIELGRTSAVQEAVQKRGGGRYA